MSQMSLSLTLTGLTIAQAAAVTALLANGGQGNVSTSVATDSSALTSRTAGASQAGAHETKAVEPELPKIADFKGELVPLLQAFAKKNKAAFEALMKKHGFAKVTDIESRPDTWGPLALACKG